ncbi:MAG: ABC transporter ATP-binding protein, partial [Crocinitomicaceae bacterium]|nr:ABC transporter ATP-binding protein [Crocinitomicaceae bacterium]
MRHGEVVESGPCQGVMNAPKHPYTQSLLAAMPKVRDASAHANRATGPAGDAPLVAARRVVKRFVARTNVWGKPTHTFDALKGVDLAIAPGERVGLVGESGSGKSTLGNILLGLDTWDDGDVTWKGGAPKGATFRRAAQPVFQDPFSALNPSMTVGAALQEAVDARADKHGPSVAGLLEEVGLSASDASRKPGSFSGGQRQRIVLARALALSP